MIYRYILYIYIVTMLSGNQAKKEQCSWILEGKTGCAEVSEMC